MSSLVGFLSFLFSFISCLIFSDLASSSLLDSVKSLASKTLDPIKRIVSKVDSIANQATGGLWEKYHITANKWLKIGETVYSTLAETPNKPESRVKYEPDGSTMQGDEPQIFIQSNSQNNGDSGHAKGSGGGGKNNGQLNGPMRPFAANLVYKSFAGD